MSILFDILERNREKENEPKKQQNHGDVQSECMRLSRLRGRKICDRVMRKGLVWKGRHMTIRWLPGPPRAARGAQGGSPLHGIFVGMLASTKLHKSAVKRNRMRRRCREALRIVVREMKEVPTVQVLIGPKLSSLTAPFGEIQDDMRVFLKALQWKSVK
jgi:ribonuclease P protein component